MSNYKLGKLPAVKPYGLSDLSVYATGKLPAPPSECDYHFGLSLPMDANDRLGCCVMSGIAHLIAAWNAEVKEHDPVPTETQVVDEYFKLTGGQDSGLVESTTLGIWHKTGLFGKKIEGFTTIAPSNIVEIHQAIAFYGGAMFGIQCPQSAQEQFANGEPWTYVKGSPIVGGHCIVPLGYDAEYVACATWGGIALVTYSFLAHFLDESYAIISSQFVEAGHGPRLDLEALEADLASI